MIPRASSLTAQAAAVFKVTEMALTIATKTLGYSNEAAHVLRGQLDDAAVSLRWLREHEHDVKAGLELLKEKRFPSASTPEGK